MPVSINPATGVEIATYDTMSDGEIEERLSLAASRFETWRHESWDMRRRILTRTAELLRDRAGRLGELMACEMGKPIAQAEAEAEKCAWVCDYYAEHAECFLQPQLVETDATRSLVRFDPLGPILAVMPWNFPLWQAFRFAAPNIVAGNVGLLKHASNVTGCALAIEELFRDAGAPDGVFQTLIIDHDQAERVMRDGRVRGITLTGSVAAGRTVGRVAGETLKPSVLELGGSDPFIVLADCDLEATIDGAVTGRTQNNGQSCIAAKRFIVERAILDRFTQRFLERMEGLVIGDPLDRATDIGPLAQPKFVHEIHDQVTRTQAAGGALLTGGAPLGDWCLLHGAPEKTAATMAASSLVDDAPHRLARDSLPSSRLFPQVLSPHRRQEIEVVGVEAML